MSKICLLEVIFSLFLLCPSGFDHMFSEVGDPLLRMSLELLIFETCTRILVFETAFRYEITTPVTLLIFLYLGNVANGFSTAEVGVL